MIRYLVLIPTLLFCGWVLHSAYAYAIDIRNKYVACEITDCYEVAKAQMAIVDSMPPALGN